MIARHLVLGLLRRIEHARLELVAPRGRRYEFGPPDAGLRATVTVHDDSFWRSALRGSIGLGEAYAAGAFDADDLVSLCRIGAREMPRLDRLRPPLAALQRLRTRVPRNTRSRSRDHIAAHYDLGNDLFRLFLDDSMTYSCGIWEEPGITLGEAQQAKLERVCERLELSPTDHLLEIGTGWGALALHAAGEYGCRVTTTTLSLEQRELALERVRDAGLDDRIEVLASDYRDLRGRYDKLVSIEMIEAVGWQYFDDYFRACSRLLAPDGLALIQAITIDERAYEVEKAARSFANELIFPGGCLPSVAVMRDCVARVTDMRVVGLEDITDDYPPTLAAWRERFLAAEEELEALGYDRRFRRLWELYFAMSEGGFRERRIRDVQMRLAGAAHRPREARAPDRAIEWA